MANMVRDTGNVSWARWFARIIGIVLVLVGLWGFFTPNPLGINFELTTVHNWVHILTGLVALYFGFANTVTTRQVAVFALVFGTIYLLLGILGFFVTEIVGIILALPDNYLHLAIGVFGILAGAATYAAAGETVRERRPAV